jgi:hypothetical protein
VIIIGKPKPERPFRKLAAMVVMILVDWGITIAMLTLTPILVLLSKIVTQGNGTSRGLGTPAY